MLAVVLLSNMSATTMIALSITMEAVFSVSMKIAVLGRVEKMPNEKLIYASAARRAILKADPSLAYVIDEVKGVDVVEVVRCKDCEHYKQNPWSKEENMMCMCWCDWIATDPDDFCSQGERREGE